MSQTEVRVRIAPSPSGYVHVGTARTAVFNYLFARRHKGRFLIRIEDTDRERSDPAYIEAILAALQWLGLSWDEDIVYQSRRTDLYKSAAQKILENGHAYRCFCTREQLEADRARAKAEKGPLRYNRRCLGLSDEEIESKLAAGMPYVLRLRIPDGTCAFDDLVSGPLSRANEEIEDLIIARSDGTATYNLAVVVDDHAMGVTHVIRGNDHVTNTFKQIHIYQALGWAVPAFGHVPLILRPDKRKVSKRLGDKDVMAYMKEGILPEAMFNYLCLLGWSAKSDREIYSPEELERLFTEANFNASNAIFDEEKLLAFNKEHIARKSDHDLAVLVAPLLVEAGLTTKYWLETRWEYLRSVIGALKGRASRLHDFVERGGYFFQFDYKYDEAAASKHFDDDTAAWLEELASRYENLEPFNADGTERVLSEFAEEKAVKKGRIIHPVRLAVSGMPVGPSLYEMLEILGRRVVVERLRKAVELIRGSHPA